MTDCSEGGCGGSLWHHLRQDATGNPRIQGAFHIWNQVSGDVINGVIIEFRSTMIYIIHGEFLN
jgi:hypothetical protein